MCAEGSGKFYPMRTFPDFLYKKMVQREKVGMARSNTYTDTDNTHTLTDEHLFL